MPKSLNDVLKGVRKSSTEKLTTGDNPGVDYAAKMKDTRDFVAQHTIEKHADRAGNEDPANAVKKAEMKRHGHEPKPKDIKVYNKTQQNEEVEQIDELQGYQGKKGQKALYKLHTRASQRMNKALDNKDKKTTGRNFRVMDMAYDRMKEEVVAEDYEKDAADLSKKYASYAKHEKAQSKSNSLAAQLSPAYRQERAATAKRSNAISKRFYKKAVTGMDEEVEQIDEISNRAKSAYLGKAVADLVDRSQEHGYNVAKKKKNLGDNARKISNRQDGIYRATKGMRKEETELEEAKAPEIGSYHKVDTEGSHGKHVVTNVADGVVYHQNVKTKEKHRTRVSEWANASSPIKEEVEQINEALSADHKSAITKHIKKMWGKGTISFEKQDGKHFVSHSDGIQTHVHSIDMKKGVPHVTHFMSMDEETELTEAKCNMTEAGKMCEVHGDKDCSASDKEPRYTGKKKEGKQLIVDKKTLKEVLRVNEGLSDQRSSKATASEQARKDLVKDMRDKRKEKMKEESAATDTNITFPVNDSREGFKL